MPREHTNLSRANYLPFQWLSSYVAPLSAGREQLQRHACEPWTQSDEARHIRS
jgi:hypothetical protein